MRILPAITDTDLAEVRALFTEYAAELQVDLCFQRFQEELAALPGPYAPPKGRLFLAREEGTAAGCGAFRPLGDGICEMKRLYVRPRFRGRGIGRALATILLREARRAGYGGMRLDTLESLGPALGLYASLGFHRVAPYYANPLPRVF